MLECSFGGEPWSDKCGCGWVQSALLEEQKGQPTHQAIRTLQAVALAELLQKEPLFAATAAELATEVVKMAWHGNDACTVIAAMTPKRVPAANWQRRRQQQSWQAVVEYGTQELWDFLKSQSPANAKLDALVDLSLGLGLRCPTEPSAK